MGTETLIYRLDTLHPYQLVKLNNPLMGTETPFFVLNQILLFGKLVKLNNPLMGTETRLLSIT